MEIRLLETLREDQLTLLKILIANNPLRKAFSGFEPVDISGRIFMLELSHTLIARRSNSGNHPHRIWLDIFTHTPLGAGGNGVVTDAPRSLKYDSDLNTLTVKVRNVTQYAMKIIQVKENRDLTEKLQSAQQEINLMTQLHLPHKTQPKLATLIGRTIYLMLKKLSGINFQEYLDTKTNRELQIGRTFSIFIQGGQSLREIHVRLKHLHLDLKPGNMVYDDIENLLQICDFGLADPIIDDLELIKNCGTRGFKAPETFANQPLTEKTDAYSLAKSMSVLLKQQPPARQITAYSLEISQLMRKYPIQTELPHLEKLLKLQCRAATIPHELRDLVNDMATLSPKKRLPLTFFNFRTAQLANSFLQEYAKYLNNAVAELTSAVIRNAEWLPVYHVLLTAQREWQDELGEGTEMKDLLVSYDMHFERLIDSLIENNTPELISPTSSPTNDFADNIELDQEEEEAAAILGNWAV